MPNLKIEVVEQTGTVPALTIEDMIQSLERNRDRVRTLGNLLITACSLFLSSIFVVLFFLIKETSFGVPFVVPILMFASLASFTLSIAFSVYSAVLPPQTAIRNRIELIDFLASTYYSEQRRAIRGVFFLIVGIILYAVSLTVFAVRVL